ncbi:hypothetical protein BHF71_10060 [Vulcanibacillus modesticaldus]|uniref:TadE-like domain-containing protein n=1 Tax=Vulcanibacillus modesticaldus TaxID=337097 RepID=A0A1D2YTV8_9BACI|nr:TadE family protein [Vulcanibacillus modesticaldus]OEF99138.1 hypothetical protein BHF71_10060 [Vulcanibacillus modesticaldus]
MNILKTILLNKKRNQNGQATIELAIILPIVLLLVMMIIYSGIFTFSKSVVLLAAHSGGREGMFIWNKPTYTQEEKIEHVRQAINRVLDSLPNSESSDIDITDDGNGILMINVTYYFKLNLPFLEDITVYEAVPLQTEVIYRYNQPPEEG